MYYCTRGHCVYDHFFFLVFDININTTLFSSMYTRTRIYREKNKTEYHTKWTRCTDTWRSSGRRRLGVPQIPFELNAGKKIIIQECYLLGRPRMEQFAFSLLYLSLPLTLFLFPIFFLIIRYYYYNIITDQHPPGY